MSRGGALAAPWFPRPWWCGWLLVVAFALWPRSASAEEPEISATVDTQRLGVGEVLRLSLHVASSRAQPSNPQPGNTKGFTVVGTSSHPTQQISIMNGRMTSQRGLDVAWSLRADKVGSWSVGPVAVQVGNTSYSAGPIRVVVVAAGQGPARAGSDPADPFGGHLFDPFGGGAFDPLRGLLDSINGQGRPRDASDVDPKLALDAPLGAVAFLHATVDTTRVVVGEQVTVSIYLYVDAGVRDPGLIDMHEATAADFVKKSLYEDDNGEHGSSKANVGGRLFRVHLLRRMALFPLRAGDLVVTPMELTLQRTRATGDPTRKTEQIVVHVTEPPTEQRPVGYVLGDVGDFSLAGDVSPRDIEQDSAVGVTLTLQGTGNLPAMITPPAQAGIEWLPPEVHEKMGGTKEDRFGGTRSFAYVVRIHKTGDVALGSIRVPFWSPEARRYQVARADLGVVTVRPSTAPKVAAAAPADPFAMLPEVRQTLGGTRAAPGRLFSERPWLFWGALLTTPASFGLFSALSWLVGALRERAARAAGSPETDLRTKTAAAERAARGSDARAIEAATARALEAATVLHADVIVRDARGGEAARRLVEAGVSEQTAAEVDATLAACEAARFSPDAPDLDAARARWKQVEKILRALRRGE